MPLPRSTVLAILGLLVASAPGLAQRTARTLWDDVRHAGGNVLFIWSAPARGDARDWTTAGIVAGVSALSMTLDEPLDRWVVRDSTSLAHRGIRPLREDFSQSWLGDISTGRLLNPINGALLVVGFLADNPKLRDAGLGCFATHQASSLTRHILVYRLFPRARPSEADGNAFRWRVNDEPWKDTPWEEHSFFGGHVANAAGCAAFFSRRFHLGVAEPLMFGLAGGIGIARLVDRRHWLSDQVIGAAIGYAMGKAVADRQLRRRSRPAGIAGAALERHFDPVPTVGRLPGETRMGWTIRF